jgi:hypothetical protein
VPGRHEIRIFPLEKLVLRTATDSSVEPAESIGLEALKLLTTSAGMYELANSVQELKQVTSDMVLNQAPAIR